MGLIAQDVSEEAARTVTVPHRGRKKECLFEYFCIQEKKGFLFYSYGAYNVKIIMSSVEIYYRGKGEYSPFSCKSDPLYFVVHQQQFFDRLYFIYTVGYAVSFSSLMVAILIIGYFRYVKITSEPQLHTSGQLSRRNKVTTSS